jgi:hypothetical protein
MDYQQYALQTATSWPVSTSLALFATGILFGLQGFRFARFLMAANCAVVGFIGGGITSQIVGYPPVIGGFAIAIAAGALSLTRIRVGVTVSATVTFALAGHYLAVRFGLLSPAPLIGAAMGALIGLALAWGEQRSLPILVTTLQGAGLMVIGFVGIAASLAPSLAGTFVAFAHDISLFVPVLLTMLIALGYSVQANLQQGDIRSGSPAAGHWTSEPA